MSESLSLSLFLSEPMPKPSLYSSIILITQKYSFIHRGHEKKETNITHEAVYKQVEAAYGMPTFESHAKQDRQQCGLCSQTQYMMKSTSNNHIQVFLSHTTAQSIQTLKHTSHQISHTIYLALAAVSPATVVEQKPPLSFGVRLSFVDRMKYSRRSRRFYTQPNERNICMFCDIFFFFINCMSVFIIIHTYYIYI